MQRKPCSENWKRAKAKKPKVAIMMIGEQPGDQEDRQGRPFVGPAGKLLDKCLEEADIDRRKVYVTNIVKHFRWEPHGKLRIHKKPSMKEIHACRPWLEAELEAVRPELIVCLGATAAQSLLGSGFKIRSRTGGCNRLKAFLRSLQPCTRLPSCALAQTKIGSGIPKSSWMTCDVSQILKK
jgi:DNA polymerase